MEYESLKLDSLELKKAIVLAVQVEVERFRDEFFQKFPFESFAWTQYTPFLPENGDDICRFSVRKDDLFLNGIDKKEVLSNCQTFSLILQCKDAFWSIYDFLSKIDEDHFLWVYGDNARVIVFKDNIVNEQWIHE